jgi:hypothetical protein
MLEIPALATAIAGLCVLMVLPRTKWCGAEWLAGLLFGLAALMKLVPLYLLPLAVLIVWLRPDDQGNRGIRGIRGRLTSRWSSFRVFRGSAAPCCRSWVGLAAPLLVRGAGVATGFALTDWLIERGAYLGHFQQSWSSHFSAVKSFEYGSPAEHAFDWSIFLKNWDSTVPAALGICILIKGLPTSQIAALPLAWLALALLVFTNHKPWWAYYYIHIAIPLCWCAAVGIRYVCSALARRFGGLGWAESKGRSLAKRRADIPVRSKPRLGRGPQEWPQHFALWTRLRTGMSALRWRTLARCAPFALFGLCVAVWMEMRVYLEITGMGNTPQLHAALVLQEIGRLKPFSHWMYADPLIYSFHADIPMPPPLAVVPLKRLWAGEMTNARIAAEMAQYKPEVILLPNHTREVPFQEFLEADYRMIYQDDKVWLYADRATIRRADSAQRNKQRGPEDRLHRVPSPPPSPLRKGRGRSLPRLKVLACPEVFWNRRMARSNECAPVEIRVVVADWAVHKVLCCGRQRRARGHDGALFGGRSHYAGLESDGGESLFGGGGPAE